MVGAEERHDAVAHVARHHAGMALDGGGDVVQLALQHVDDVVGQERLGEGGEAADVGEEDGDRELLADRAGPSGRAAAPATAQTARTTERAWRRRRRRSACSRSYSSRTSRRTVTSPETRIWQARRSSGPKLSRSATDRPSGVRCAALPGAVTTTIRQVEQIAFRRRRGRRGSRRAGRRQDGLGRAALDDGLIRQDADGGHGSPGGRGWAGAVGPVPGGWQRPDRTSPDDRRPAGRSPGA